MSNDANETSEDILVDYVVTQEDIDNDPDLQEMDAKAGDTVQYPEGETPADTAPTEEEEEEEIEGPEPKKEAPVGADGKPLPSWMVA